MKATIKTVLANTDEFPDIHFEELGNNKDKELFFNEYWANYVIADRLELKDILDKKQEYLYGRTWQKLNVGNGRIESEVLEPYDILIDRYVDPTDPDSADHLTHLNIFRTLGQLQANPFYDQNAVKRLLMFFGTAAGLIKAEETTIQAFRKNQRLQEMGVPGINNPILGETVVELKAHYVKVFDAADQKEHWHLIVKCLDEILMAKLLPELIGVDFLPFVTWADDIERNDFYSDGIADIVRTPNKVLNVWFSQLVENRTLQNFGMNFYDATHEGFVPQSFEPIPGGWYPLPGKPDDIVKHVQTAEMGDTLQDLDYIKGIVESATAATAATKGDTQRGEITLGEVKLVTAAAMERITSIAKYYNLARRDFGDKWAKMVNANADKLDAVKVYKKSHKGNWFEKSISPKDLTSTKGWNIKVESNSERDKKNTDMVQKVTAVAAQFPGNLPMMKIKDKKLLDFISLNPEEEKQVMDFQEQMLKQQQQAGAAPAQPGQPPQASGQPQPKVGETINFKDLPPDGQKQMAAQAGIQIQSQPAQVTPQPNAP